MHSITRLTCRLRLLHKAVFTCAGQQNTDIALQKPHKLWLLLQEEKNVPQKL